MLLLVAYVVWGLWANEHAEREARALCAAIRVGDPVARVDELGKGEHAPGNLFKHENYYRHMYYGMIYTARECRVTFADGRVQATEVILHEDD